jgi:hypothetical protein
LRLDADRAPTLDRRNGTLGVLRRRPERKGIADQDRRDTPGGDGAGRVAVERLAECLFARRKREGVEQRNAALAKLSCASGAQELAKATVPSFWPARPVSGAATAGLAASVLNANKKTSRNERNRALRIV